jgi:glycosyltransferase involved in cell wall biosynthesis
MPLDQSVRTRTVRVLWLAKGLGRGGTERLMVEMASGFDPARYRIDVAYVMPIKDALVAELRSRGLSVVCLGRPSDHGPRWVLRLNKLLNKEHYDIIHTHMPVPAVAARLAHTGHPPSQLIHTEHNVWQRYRRPTYWGNALTYKRNAKVIAVSEAVAESIDRRWLPDEERLVVVRHGLCLSERQEAPSRAEARRELGLPEDGLVVGTVGNLTPKKGHSILIDAFERLRVTNPDARLVIIGGGPLEQRLRSELVARGLADVVLMTGSRADVQQLLPAFDIYASASLYEGLPIAVVEALAAGLPVVVTDAGGTGEVVRSGVDGLVVQAGDAESLTDALRLLGADPERRAAFATAARMRSRDFDIGSSVRQIQHIYDEVVTAT